MYIKDIIYKIFKYIGEKPNVQKGRNFFKLFRKRKRNT